MSNKKEYKKNPNKPKSYYKRPYNLKLRKSMLTSYNEFSNLKNTDIKNNEIKKPINTENYYKNPFFYNENNLDLQLQILKELKNININRNSTPKNHKINITSNTNTISNTNTNANTNTNTKYSNFFTKKRTSINDSSEKNDNLSKYESTLTNFKFPNISKNLDKENNNIKVEINSYKYNNENDEKKSNNFLVKNLDKLSMDTKFNYTSYKNSPKNIRKNDDAYFYKIIFKSKPSIKLDKNLIIDNKLNIKYAENEEQYKKIVQKEYKQLMSEGRRVKSKNLSPSIKVKLNEAKNKMHFMKGVIDYSYPRFILSKIKIMQKQLNEQKNKTLYINCVSGKDLRNIEKNIRNNSRKDYLLKSITLIK